MSENLITKSILYFIPSDSFNEELNGLPGAYVAVCLITAILTLLVAIFLPFSPLSSEQLINAEVIALLTAAGYLGGLLILRYSGHLIVSINLYSVTVFANILSIVFLTGGFSESPQLILMLFVPIWSFIMLEAIYGFLASIAVVIAVVLLYVLEAQGFVFPQYIPEQAIPYMRLQAWIGLLLIVTACLYTHVHKYNALNERLSNERGRFAYESLHDPLTGLCNRTLFYKRARAAIEHTLDGELKMAIIYLDVDEFKPINDELGHEVGDNVLKIIASRLMLAVRSSDTVARLGGDEFGIVLHGMADKDVARVISEKIVTALSAPIVTAEHELRVGSSLGVVVGPDNGTQLDALVRQADNAMYEAKRGVDKICFA
ncbi:GGDEF domain-containing protein [Oceanicoccus sp. KOV_DT_Chl]|uniref:GGDEF domain-containing protein n=1 Tax=Oceanicoccus sp. KOV_DT_Chl TaxID=1904639 RepID=UPI000C7BE07A|nr:GGDEF domain-containing protein [Oceanicoccus sp. KOV_DT_Chl]